MVLSFVHWALPTLFSLVHPFFVSMTDLNHNSSEKVLEISVRIFTDDFENTLRKNFPGKIDIVHPANQEQVDGFVTSYIQQHLKLVVNDAPVTLAFVGYEQQGESIWSYFEVKNVAVLKKLQVVNSLLHDYTDKQVNMLHVSVGDKEKSYKLDFPATTTTFTF